MEVRAILEALIDASRNVLGEDYTPLREIPTVQMLIEQIEAETGRHINLPGDIDCA